MDVVLDALAIRLTEGYAAGAPLLTRALKLLLAQDMGSDEVGRSLWLAASRSTQAIATELWDADAVNTLACLLYTSPSPRDLSTSRMPSSA